MNIKNVEPVLLPVPRSKGLRIARLVETNNAESPHAECYSNTHTTTVMTHKSYIYTIRAVYKHPKGRSRCLVFD